MKYIIVIILLFSIVKTEAQPSVLNVADSLFTIGNYTKAINTYKKHDNKEETLEKIARAYQALGIYDEAIRYYNLGLKVYPNNTKLKYNYSKLLASTNKLKEAKALFLELIDSDYKNPNYHYQLGVVYDGLSDEFNAQNRYFSAFELDPTHQKAIFKLAKFHLKKRHHKTAKKYIDIGLKSYQNNKQLISLKAQNYYWQEYYGKAKEQFEKLLNLNESSKFIHEKLSFCYLQTYNYGEAIEQIKLALKYDNRDVNNLYVLVQLYEKVENFEQAETYLKLMLELKDTPLDKEYRKLGVVLNRQKKYDEAIMAFNRAIKENPKDELAYFYKLTAKLEYYKDLDSKIKAINMYMKKFPESRFAPLLNRRLSDLKSEQFQEED